MIRTRWVVEALYTCMCVRSHVLLHECKFAGVTSVCKTKAKFSSCFPRIANKFPKIAIANFVIMPHLALLDASYTFSYFWYDRNDPFPPMQHKIPEQEKLRVTFNPKSVVKCYPPRVGSKKFNKGDFFIFFVLSLSFLIYHLIFLYLSYTLHMGSIFIIFIFTIRFNSRSGLIFNGTPYYSLSFKLTPNA